MSYHIHTLFWQMSAESVTKAMEFQQAFFDEFELNGVEICTFEAPDPQPNIEDICAFEIDWMPSGPFVTANFAFFVPKGHYEKAVSWSMQNRGDLDIFVHPNSGCHVEDHIKWSVWGGNKWVLDVSVFPP